MSDSNPCIHCLVDIGGEHDCATASPYAAARTARLAELKGALRAAPAFVGVWNILGERSVSDGALSAFVDAYNAWASEVRAALTPTQEEADDRR